MVQGDPLAFFITWTVYGTFLQGDERWWKSRKQGEQRPEPRLEQWRKERLKHSIVLLNDLQRTAVDREMSRLAEYRKWRLWARSVRSNHVHVVVSSPGYDGKKVRDQFKANCTRVLRETWIQFVDRPVWTTGGDWKCLNSEGEIEQAALYVSVAQDRKHLDEE